MNKIIQYIIIIALPLILFADSITLTPDTLNTTIQSGDVNTETVMITNNNSFPVTLNINISDQPQANRQSSLHSQFFIPDNEALAREMEPDIQYQDENGNWVEG